MNFLIIFLLTLGIIAIKIFWISTEVKLYKHRVNNNMIKTNSVEAIILIAQIICALYFPWPDNPLDKYLIPFGFVLYIAGIVLALWSKLTMKEVWGIPGERYKNQNELITKGPFAISRNPIYVGFTFLYVGYCLAIRSWLVILRIPLFIYFYKSALKEEKHLEKEFGKQYLKYKRRVPRFLII